MSFIKKIYLFVLLLISIHSISAQKLKDKSAGFYYTAPPALTIPGAYQTFNLKFPKGVLLTPVMDKVRNDLALPGVKLLADSSLADVLFELKFGEIKKLYQEIKISGEGADKRYFYQVRYIMPEISLYAIQQLPTKKFLYKIEFKSDTLDYNTSQYASSAELKKMKTNEFIKNGWYYHIGSTLISKFNDYKDAKEDFWRFSMFYVKDKSDELEAYQDAVKEVTKDTWDGSIKYELSTEKKAAVVSFINNTLKAKDYISTLTVADKEEMIEGLQYNLAFSYLWINDYSSFLLHLKQIQQYHKNELADLVEFAKLYQNRTIRSGKDFSPQKFFEGEWNLVKMHTKSKFDLNGDGQFHSDLIGNELNDCLLKESITFNGSNILYKTVDRKTCLIKEENYCWSFINRASDIPIYLALGSIYEGKCDIDNKLELMKVSNLELILKANTTIDVNSDTTQEVYLHFKKQ